MINGIHALIHAKNADKARAFFRDVLKLRSVDAGHGWLIFALPPAELGIHPAEKTEYTELYLVCDDIDATVKDLKSKGAEIARPIKDENFGCVTAIKIPGGGEIGLYQPKHSVAIR